MFSPSLVQASLTYKGVDWSSVTLEEAAGYTYKTTSGMTEALEKILHSSGVNTVRQRVWVNPSSGDYDLACMSVFAIIFQDILRERSKANLTDR